MTKHLVTFFVVFAACITAFFVFNEYQTRKYRTLAYLAEGVQFGVAFKGPVAAYFQDNGRFPNNNEEAGLGPAEQHQGQSVSSVAVGAGGTIVVTYNEKSGVAGGTLHLIPSAPHGVNGPVSWRCMSPSFPHIQQVLPTCTHGSVAK